MQTQKIVSVLLLSFFAIQLFARDGKMRQTDNLYEKKDVKSKVVAKVGNGQLITVTSENDPGSFYPAVYSGKSGYVLKTSIQFLDPVTSPPTVTTPPKPIRTTKVPTSVIKDTK